MFRTLGSFLVLAFAIALVDAPRAQSQARAAVRKGATRDVSAHKDYGTHFQTSDRCFACHNGITTSTGEDISIGINWRTSMMGNAGRDPYWMAGVRRETIDHPDRRRAHPGRVLHLPHADDALRGEAGRRRRGSVRAHSPRPEQARRPAGGRWGVVLGVPPDHRSELWQAGQLCRRLQDRREGRAWRAPHLWPVRSQQRSHDDHEIVLDVPAAGKQAHSRLGAVRHLPHAADAGAGRPGQGDRRVAGAGAVSGMAAQRLQGNAKLPVLSHAGREGGRPNHVRVWRAPGRLLAAHVRRRQLLHAADAEPLPQ